jgi:hypothetical protein
MNLTEGLLIVIVLILTVIVLSGRLNQKPDPVKTKTWDCVNRDTGDVTSVKMSYSAGAKTSPEVASLAENAEHFEGCRNSAEDTARALDCMCDGDDKFEYAVNEFGAPGMEYKDWVASQSIDPTVIKNHAEFVADRQKLSGSNILGKTMSPDNHSADQILWWGLRRPQAVPVCNPTQISSQMDNLDWYDVKPKFNWDSGAASAVQ